MYPKERKKKLKVGRPTSLFGGRGFRQHCQLWHVFM